MKSPYTDLWKTIAFGTVGTALSAPLLLLPGVDGEAAAYILGLGGGSGALTHEIMLRRAETKIEKQRKAEFKSSLHLT